MVNVDAGTPAVADRGGTGETVAAIQSLFAEAVALFHRLRVVAEQIHDQDGMTAGLRSVLFDLHRSGPRTVPRMARARPVARQHIQGLVDQLKARGLVELDANPDHRRSHLVRLTEPGRALAESMSRRETELLQRLEMPVSADQAKNATEVLRTVRELLARPDFQRILASTRAEMVSTDARLE